MNEQIENKKTKRNYFALIIWAALILTTIFVAKGLIHKFSNKKLEAPVEIVSDGDFTNLDAEIYQTNSGDSKVNSVAEKPLNQTEILLKQQLQISELQNNFNDLKMELMRIKSGDSLSKIILSFVKLQDLVEQKQNYDSELQKLELLCRADFALSRKIEKLELALQSKSKSNQELIKEFSELTPILKAKKIEIDNKNSWLGKAKALIAKFIIIKRTGEKSGSEFEIVILKLQKDIEGKQYDVALQSLDSIGLEYQEILVNFKVDLQNANNFEKINSEIYKYLELLSN